MTDLENPFSVTKATEFTDKQINEYWVDFNFEDQESILSLLNPTEYLPKYILGGKGCGKTHILRYFSYTLQKIRHSNDFHKIIFGDKYIGIYSVLEGINSSRFTGKGISEDEWQSVFEYYFELYLTTNLINVICDFFTADGRYPEKESEVVEGVFRLFYLDEPMGSSTFQELIVFINDLRRKIDTEIVNAAYTRSLNYESVKILFSPGDLIFGIPQLLSARIEDLKDVKFIFILDEYEKLFEWQKEFINTLVWDKKIPTTFWVGARKYGYTTTATKSGEKMRPGSEYQPIDLDNVIRKNEILYRKFAKELFAKRIIKFFEQKGQYISHTDVEKRFVAKFQKYSNEILLEEVKEKCRGKYYHAKHLSDRLKEAIRKKIIQLEDASIPQIVNGLLSETNGDPLEQKLKLLLFYKLWYEQRENLDVIKISDEVNKEYVLSVSGQESRFDNLRDKFLKDMVAQIAVENEVKNSCYSGIDEFIDLSWGNVRTFILVLKKIIELARLRGEKPLEEGSIISLETQYLAIYNTSRWFYDDAELIGDKGKNVYKSINALADLFRVYRFSDKPSETSVSSFSFVTEELSESSLETIELARIHSFLIEMDEGRKGKNTSGRIEKHYQLNKILAPLWNLPVSRRGSLNLSSHGAETLFNPKFFSDFKRFHKEAKRRLNAPFLSKEESNKGFGKHIDTPTLL